LKRGKGLFRRLLFLLVDLRHNVVVVFGTQLMFSLSFHACRSTQRTAEKRDPLRPTTPNHAVVTTAKVEDENRALVAKELKGLVDFSLFLF